MSWQSNSVINYYLPMINFFYKLSLLGHDLSDQCKNSYNVSIYITYTPPYWFFEISVDRFCVHKKLIGIQNNNNNF